MFKRSVNDVTTMHARKMGRKSFCCCTRSHFQRNICRAPGIREQRFFKVVSNLKINPKPDSHAAERVATSSESSRHYLPYFINSTFGCMRVQSSLRASSRRQAVMGVCRLSSFDVHHSLDCSRLL